MTSYESNLTVADVASRLRQASRLVITSHAKPDGDALGSVVAMAAALTDMGKTVTALIIGPVPASFAKLRGGDLWQLHDQSQSLPDADQIVVLDTGATGQLQPLAAALAERSERLLIVDHHLSGDLPAAYRYIDAKAAACCEIVAQILDALVAPATHPGDAGDAGDASDASNASNASNARDWTKNPTICDALFMGIASDTGWFRFSNTRPYTHELAARLQRAGVDHSALYQQLEQTDRPEKLSLMIRALDSLKLVAGGQGVVMTLTANDFETSGAMLEETERLIDLPQSVAGVGVVALITQPPGDKPGHNSAVRVSLRSKPGPDAVDVAALAGQFGGGGHARAAGAKINASLDDVRQQVIAAMEAALGRNQV